MKLELLTNAAVVDDTIRFVAEHDRSDHNIENYQKEELKKKMITNKVF
jgi:hypothetical protein